MEERLTVLDTGLWKAVRQTRMESGDIELFKPLRAEWVKIELGHSGLAQGVGRGQAAA
jgi:hypothetical protein